MNSIKMKTIQWTRDLEIGLPEIGDDPKTLLTYLTDLFLACAASQGPAVLKNTLGLVQLYTREHFVLEEDLMRKMGFSGLDEHRSAHTDLISKLDDLIDEFNTGASHELSNKTLQFLEDWLLHHILIDDKKFGKHVGAID